MANILVVEDEQLVAKDIEISLSKMGHTVVGVAASGADALRIAMQLRPDLVLMDVRIEGEIDGIQTAEILRERLDLSLVYVTAHADAGTVARAKRTQPSGYLLKPFRESELRGAVEIALYKGEAERRLRERERWFSTTLRAIGDAVITVDPLGQVTFMNPVAETMLGVGEDQARGRPLTELLCVFSARTGDALHDPAAAALTGRCLVRLPPDSVLATEAGELAVHAAASPILADDGAALGAVVVFQDVSQQSRLHMQIAAADRFATLGMLAASVAHDINNPLAYIISNSEVLGDGLGEIERGLATTPGEGRARELRVRARELRDPLIELRQGAERIRRIAADLRVFAAERDPRWKRLDVCESVEWALRITSNQIRHRARLVRALEPVPRIEASENQLGQVFVSLLMNACQSIPEGAVESHEIHVATRSEAGRVVVTVSDTGAGIAAEHAHRIFEPFHGASGEGGSGLNLSICESIVKSFGGTVRALGKPGGGNIFEVSFPTAESHEPATVAELAPLRAARRGRILVIDDEPLVVRTLIRILSADHDLTTHHDARRALALLEQGESFDLVLCDVMMPGFSGMDFYAKVLEIAPALAPRIAFMTGGGFTPRSNEFLASVPNPRVDKPFERSELLALLQSVLQEPR